jgi:RecB family endonuclease NucS
MAMMKRLRDLFGQEAHDQVVQAVEDTLRTWKWEVVKWPLVGPLHPDIIARDPHGALYVFEVKTGSGQAHLGAVAQVEAYRNSVGAQLGKPAKGVLVLSGEAPEQLNDVARRAGVELVHTRPNDLEAVRESLLSLWGDSSPSWR